MTAPRRTRPGRIAAYLAEMFAPLVTVPYGIATFLACYVGLGALAGAGPVRLTARAAAGAASMVLFLLLMRVYDELKDVETDLALAAAGDPKYRDRPVPAGRVQVGDLVWLRFAVSGLLVALNLPMGAPLPLAGFAVAFLAAWLSFRWFFWPAVKRSLALAFVTHNPISLVLQGYVACVFLADQAGAALPPGAAWLLVGLWLPPVAWELSRKIRLPEDETDYPTYSRLLGWRTAALAPALPIALSAAALAWVGRKAGLGWPALAPLVAAAGLFVGRCVLLRLAPTRERTKLQPYAELYGAVANLDLVVALVFARGLST